MLIKISRYQMKIDRPCYLGYFSPHGIYTKLHSKHNAAARRRFCRRIVHTLRKPTTQPTKLGKECDLVLV
jgi:hypothetical protein